jgi:hypothetical protein
VGWGKFKKKLKKAVKIDTKKITTDVLGRDVGGLVNDTLSSKNIATYIPIAAVAFESGRRELLNTPYASYFQGQINGVTGGIGGDLLAGVADRITNGAPEEFGGAGGGGGGGGYFSTPADGLDRDGGSGMPGWILAVAGLVVGAIAFLFLRRSP